MATVADAVEAVAAYTNSNPGHVEHIARRLQEADILPRAVGSAVPEIRIADLANLLLAFLTGAQLKNCAADVRLFGGLVPHGVDVNVMPPGVRPAAFTARDAVEETLRNLATGTDDERGAALAIVLEIVSTWPEVALHSKGGTTRRFVATGTDATHWQHDVRRSVAITGVALSRIVADLQLTR